MYYILATLWVKMALLFLFLFKIILRSEFNNFASMRNIYIKFHNKWLIKKENPFVGEFMHVRKKFINI